jgi:hypothetical protein
VRFHTPEGKARYDASGINEQVFPALAEAQAAGTLLLGRTVMTDEGPLLFQYRRSYEDLDAWVRRLPHMAWWCWLLENSGSGLSFNHEIYR